MVEARHIMVVEDDSDLRHAIVCVLEDEGFGVSPSDDGEEALEKLRAGGVGLVFLDLTLGRTSGREFMATHRREAQLCRTPVVLVSGEAGLSETARRLGAVAHLRKPFETGCLLEMARRLCMPSELA